MAQATKEKTGLEDLLITKMQILYNTEKEIVKALPKMAQQATDAELQHGFEQHVEETRGQVEKLEEAFEKLGEKPQAKQTESIKGMIEDAKMMMDELPRGPTLDAELAASAQAVEHLEIAGYGSACEWAKETGHDDVAEILEDILAEEKQTDEKLSRIATSKLNPAAKEEVAA